MAAKNVIQSERGLVFRNLEAQPNSRRVIDRRKSAKTTPHLSSLTSSNRVVDLQLIALSQRGSYLRTTLPVATPDRIRKADGGKGPEAFRMSQLDASVESTL